MNTNKKRSLLKPFEPETPTKKRVPLTRATDTVQKRLFDEAMDQDTQEEREYKEGQRATTTEEKEKLLRLGYPTDREIMVCTSKSEKNAGREYYFIPGLDGFKGWVNESFLYSSFKAPEKKDEEKEAMEARIMGQLTSICERLTAIEQILNQ